MPLKNGSSNNAVSENIKMEMEHGKSHKEAITIAMKKIIESKKGKKYENGV